MKLKKIGILIMTLALSLGSATIYASNEESNLMEESVKDDNNQVTMEGQTLGLAEVENARQLGGYYTEDGRRIKSNMLLRSAKLVKATDEDIKKLTQDYNLGTIVDFRTTDEIADAPDPEIKGVKNEQIRVLDEDNANDSNSAAMTQIYGKDPVSGLIEMVKNGTLSDDMYVTTIKSETAQKGFSEFFKVLLNNEEEKAVLWHCTGGKDRAGTAAVLVLSALGVDEKTILDDFALTNEFYKGKIEYMGNEAAKQTDDQTIIEGVKTLSGVSRSFMEKMINTLNEEYGSVQNYIVEELGITQDEIIKLLLLHTGMRVGEMIALRWRDWKGDYLVIEKSVSTAKNRNKKSEDENNYISLEGSTKNQKARNIQLNREAKYILWKLKHSRESCEQDDLIVPTKTGKMNTASNLEHRMKVIMKNAGLEDVKGGLHIFRKTFATKMYENGARVEEIAAYIGDLPSTTQKYYIAIRRKVVADGEMHQIVRLPGSKNDEEPVA